MKVVYPVCFYEEEEGGYSVHVPDLSRALDTNAWTCGDTLEDALYMAEDLIAGLVLTEIEEGRKIPTPSKIEDIELDTDEEGVVSKFKNYIVVDVTEYAEKWNSKAVRKNLTIPQWLNTKAEEMNLNFSKVLQEALMQQITK